MTAPPHVKSSRPLGAPAAALIGAAGLISTGCSPWSVLGVVEMALGALLIGGMLTARLDRKRAPAVARALDRYRWHIVGGALFSIVVAMVASRLGPTPDEKDETACLRSLTSVEDAIQRRAFDEARAKLLEADATCGAHQGWERAALRDRIEKGRGSASSRVADSHADTREPSPPVDNSPPRAERNVESPAPGGDARAALPPGVYRTKPGYLAATSQAKLDKAIELAAQDGEAFKLYLQTEPGVFPLGAGLEVLLVDTAGLFDSAVKIRKRGQLAEVWTVREALER